MDDTKPKRAHSPHIVIPHALHRRVKAFAAKHRPPLAIGVAASTLLLKGLDAAKEAK